MKAGTSLCMLLAIDSVVRNGCSINCVRKGLHMLLAAELTPIPGLEASERSDLIDPDEVAAWFMQSMNYHIPHERAGGAETLTNSIL